MYGTLCQDFSDIELTCETEPHSVRGLPVVAEQTRAGAARLEASASTRLLRVGVTVPCLEAKRHCRRENRGVSISRLLVGLMWPSRPYLSAVPQRCWDVEHAHRRHQLLVENAASIPAVNSEGLNHSLAVSEIIAISGLRVTVLLVTCFSILFLKDPDLSPKVSAYSSLM